MYIIIYSIFCVAGAAAGAVATPLPLPARSAEHVETIQFYVLHAPTPPLVLGRPWFDKHDPHISWSSGQILGWSVACHANRLRPALSPSSGTKPSVPPPSLAGIPAAYHDLTPVFSKESALFFSSPSPSVRLRNRPPPGGPSTRGATLQPVSPREGGDAQLYHRIRGLRHHTAILLPRCCRGFSSCPRRTAA